MSILIKPHHFMDIIKLYGSGMENFIPDEERGHDFHKIANEILENHQIELKMTIDIDDICRPCNRCQNQICVDKVNKPNYKYKLEYNQMLDQALIKELNLYKDTTYTAYELCKLMLEHHTCIFQIWHVDNPVVTQQRHDLFVSGAQKFLGHLDRLQ